MNSGKRNTARKVICLVLAVLILGSLVSGALITVSYTHLRAHETGRNLVCRLLLEKKKTQ